MTGSASSTKIAVLVNMYSLVQVLCRIEHAVTVQLASINPVKTPLRACHVRQANTKQKLRHTCVLMTPFARTLSTKCLHQLALLIVCAAATNYAARISGFQRQQQIPRIDTALISRSAPN